MTELTKKGRQKLEETIKDVLDVGECEECETETYHDPEEETVICRFCAK